MTDRHNPYHQEFALVQAHQRELRQQAAENQQAQWLVLLGSAAERSRQPFAGLEAEARLQVLERNLRTDGLPLV